MFDPEKFGEAMGDAIREAVAPLLKRIAELEEQTRKPSDVAAEVERAVGAAVAALPAPKDGQDAVLPDVKQMVADAVAALPAPQAGKPGDPGKSLTLDDVRPLIDDAVSQIRKDADAVLAEPLALAEKARDMLLEKLGEIEQPKDGTSVTLEDVAPLIREAVKAIRTEAFEQVQAAVKAIPEPKSGAGVAGAMIDRDGRLQLTLSNGEMKCLGVVVGKDGADFTDAAFDYDGERSFVITGKGGSITKRLPIPMDRGYYRDGMPPIEKGDIVTHDGSAWIALKDTKERPSHEAKDDWRLFARKGRDGERGNPGKDGSPPPPIKLGA